MTSQVSLPRISFRCANLTLRSPTLLMSRTPANSVGVLLADSSPMQLQLLTSGLRRRPEFKVAPAPWTLISSCKCWLPPPPTSSFLRSAIPTTTSTAAFMSAIRTSRRSCSWSPPLANSWSAPSAPPPRGVAFGLHLKRATESQNGLATRRPCDYNKGQPLPEPVRRMGVAPDAPRGGFPFV